MCGQLSATFAKVKALLINIIVGSEVQLPNCPHILLKIQFFPLINQRITPSLQLMPEISSLCSATEQLSSLCCCNPLHVAAGKSLLPLLLLSSSSSSSSPLSLSLSLSLYIYIYIYFFFLIHKWWTIQIGLGINFFLIGLSNRLGHGQTNFLP